MRTPRKDWTGKRFWSVVVLEYVGIKPVKGQKFTRSQHHWLVKCDCGQTVEMSYGRLKQVGGPSCGNRKCPHSKKPLPEVVFSPEFGADYSLKSASARVRQRYKKSAENRGLRFDLSEDDFFQLVTSPCHYSGVKPQYTSETKEGTFYFGGVDRKDSSLGYSIENCVSCCTFANYAKNNYPYKQFVEWLDELAAFRMEQKIAKIVL